MTEIWLNGDRYNQAYRYDTATGGYELHQLPGAVGTTAGNGGMLGGRFVATYVAHDGRDIVLQTGTTRYPLDGMTHATARVHLGGLSTTLVVERSGMPILRLRSRTIGRWFSRRLDPTWDGLDEFVADEAAGIAALVNSDEAQRTYRRVKVSSAGPWHLLDGRSP